MLTDMIARYCAGGVFASDFGYGSNESSFIIRPANSTDLGPVFVLSSKYLDFFLPLLTRIFIFALPAQIQSTSVGQRESSAISMNFTVILPRSNLRVFPIASPAPLCGFACAEISWPAARIRAIPIKINALFIAANERRDLPARARFEARRRRGVAGKEQRDDKNRDIRVWETGPSLTVGLRTRVAKFPRRGSI